jgi:hypothetical protein
VLGGLHERSARWNRAAHRPLSTEAGARLRAVDAEQSGCTASLLERGDVFLVEGRNNIAGVIKYLTQSTWSHSALYVGPIPGCATEDSEPHVQYPILPKISLARSRQAMEQILEIRHSALYCLRDFDIAPYFNVVKPTIAKGFDYKSLLLGRSRADRGRVDCARPRF